MPPKKQNLVGDLERQRSNSLTIDSIFWNEDGNANKCKREENPAVNYEIQEFYDIRCKLNKDISASVKEVKSFYKPKTELKTLASTMSLWARKLESKMQQELSKAEKGNINYSGSKHNAPH